MLDLKTQQTIKLYWGIINIVLRIVRVNVHCTQMFCCITLFCEVSERNVINSPPTVLVSNVVSGWGCLVSRHACRLPDCRSAGMPHVTNQFPTQQTTQAGALSPLSASQPAPSATCAAQGWLAPNIRIRGEDPFTVELNIDLLTDHRKAHNDTGCMRMLSNLVKLKRRPL